MRTSVSVSRRSRIKPSVYVLPEPDCPHRNVCRPNPLACSSAGDLGHPLDVADLERSRRAHRRAEMAGDELAFGERQRGLAEHRTAVDGPGGAVVHHGDQRSGSADGPRTRLADLLVRDLPEQHVTARW